MDQGSSRTTYQPVAATVQVGDRVTRGEVVGRLTLVGSHCFPRACLHWGLIEGLDHYVDPLVLVGAVPVRLLPMGGPVGSTPPPGRPAWHLGPPVAPGPLAGPASGRLRLPLPAPRPPLSDLGPVGVPGRLALPGP